jgi:hypothetical protein
MFCIYRNIINNIFYADTEAYARAQMLIYWPKEWTHKGRLTPCSCGTDNPGHVYIRRTVYSARLV